MLGCRRHSCPDPAVLRRSGLLGCLGPLQARHAAGWLPAAAAPAELGLRPWGCLPLLLHPRCALASLMVPLTWSESGP